MPPQITKTQIYLLLFCMLQDLKTPKTKQKYKTKKGEIFSLKKKKVNNTHANRTIYEQQFVFYQVKIRLYYTEIMSHRQGSSNVCFPIVRWPVFNPRHSIFSVNNQSQLNSIVLSTFDLINYGKNNDNSKLAKNYRILHLILKCCTQYSL